MRKTKVIPVLLGLSAMAVALSAGCSPKKEEYKTFTMFATMSGSEIDSDNDVQKLIAEKTGVKVKETWLQGQDGEQAVGSMLASETLTDFIDAGNSYPTLLTAEVLVPWDSYLEKHKNLKDMYTEAEWDMFRQADGKIYWANVFQNHKNAATTCTHNDEAFWIQARVLEWGGYPKIETLDDYFDLIEKYIAANPKDSDGADYIGYTCLCEGWKYYCIENAGQFLDGYPNDGSVIVDKSSGKPTIVDYNTTDTTKRYLKKLNEEYAKGIVDKEFATQTEDEYIANLSSGHVLGMCDQYWNFQKINDTLKSHGRDKDGCNYIPLGLTIDRGMTNRWHTYGDTVNVSSGVSVTTKCTDPDAAFKFLNDVLDQEIHDLRFWGVKDVDYKVDADGKFYRTEEMRKNAADTNYKASHLCPYSYLPQWGGTSDDGINANFPTEQDSEFQLSLAEPVVNVFKAYGVGNYVDMIGSPEEPLGAWFPMWSYSNDLKPDMPGGEAWQEMGNVKHEWLPKLVTTNDFDGMWEDYMKAYEAVHPNEFLDVMQKELDRRIEAAAKYEH